MRSATGKKSESVRSIKRNRTPCMSDINNTNKIFLATGSLFFRKKNHKQTQKSLTVCFACSQEKIFFKNRTKIIQNTFLYRIDSGMKTSFLFVCLRKSDCSIFKRKRNLLLSLFASLLYKSLSLTFIWKKKTGRK